MPLLGAHMSIAGGYYKAVEAAAALEMNVVQIFTRNTNQWRAKPLTPPDIQLFTETRERLQVAHPIAHASYLINLASPDQELYCKSAEALVLELQRADAFGLEGLVVHPGAHMQATEQEGLERIVRAIDVALGQVPTCTTRLLLENTAGQGTTLGWRFEQLGYILERVAEPRRVGVCLDTCHAFAAGYTFRSARQYRELLAEIERHVGLQHVHAWHVNDSKREAGARVDRHEHIGRGHLGLEPFWRLLRDTRWQHTPMYLETAKGERAGESYDARNLLVLRTLAQNASLSAAQKCIDARGGLVPQPDD